MLTDDADRADHTGCDPFLPGEDYDPMYTGPDDRGDPLAPDRECKPYGWGIEKFEDDALTRANEAMWAEIGKRNINTYTSAGSYLETWGIFAGRPKAVNASPADREFRDFCWRVWTTWDARLWRRSERVWDRLCDTCKTHERAVQLYERWASRVTRKSNG